MKTPSSLLKLGADYLLQERNSGRTIFHTIAFHLSLHSDNKLVLCALDNVLKGICKVWFCKSVAKEVGQQSFIEHMERLYAIKNRVGQSVVEITKQKNCTTFSSKERLRCVYEAAYTELHSN